MQTTVVVGYDQTPSSERALAAAADQASRGSSVLSIVHGYQGPDAAAAAGEDPEAAADAHRKTAAQLVDDAADGVRARYPGLTVQATPVAGVPAKVLAAAAHGAELLVVGDRGRGGFPGMLLGSTAMRVLAEACSPVLVVRGTEGAPRDRVVAAVDLDGPCDDVLRFAFQEASRREAHLTVLHVWDEPWILEYDEQQGQDVADDASAILADRDERLEAHLLPWQNRFPDVQVFRQVATGSAATVLIEAAHRAGLLVTGARRHGDGQHGMQIGPVTHTLLRHADCPVAVVPIA